MMVHTIPSNMCLGQAAEKRKAEGKAKAKAKSKTKGKAKAKGLPAPSPAETTDGADESQWDPTGGSDHDSQWDED